VRLTATADTLTYPSIKAFVSLPGANVGGGSTGSKPNWYVPSPVAV
jgi:hypothetical protein